MNDIDPSVTPTSAEGALDPRPRDMARNGLFMLLLGGAALVVAYSVENPYISLAAIALCTFILALLCQLVESILTAWGRPCAALVAKVGSWIWMVKTVLIGTATVVLFVLGSISISVQTSGF